MTSRPARSGFTLVEVMAAVMLLGLFLVIMLGQRDHAIAKAAAARNLSVASRLALQMLHRIECGRIPELFDGYEGDFNEEGFPEFLYLVGIGDASRFASAAAGDSDAEQAWRDDLIRKEEEREDQEGDENKPEHTRVFVTVTYPGTEGEETYTLEALVPTWAVEQDFELYEERWGANLPEEVE